MELGFGIPIVRGIPDSLRYIFRVPKPRIRILQEKSTGSRILQAKISLIPESGIPYWVER